MNKFSDDKYISKQIIRRLPRYFRFLGELKESGVERISSTDLSQLMNVTASQIRQDLNKFGGFGQQGYGYNVNYLHKEIGRILGIDTPHNMIMIGAGNLCSAIMHYRSFPRYGFNIIAAFDVCPEKIGKPINGIEIRSMDELESFIDSHKVDIAVVTVPTSSAAEVLARLGKTNIKGIWNFAHIDVDMPNNIKVENVHLSESLMILSYNIAGMGNETK
jgi:redox-sensing transcriptional repressor